MRHASRAGRAMRVATATLVMLTACGALTACTGGSGSSPTTAAPSTRTRTVTGTRPAPVSTFTPAPATTVANLNGSGKAPKGEKFGRCPYIENGTGATGGDTPGKNLANLEGDRVGRSTILTRYQPVGCRFYFINGYEGVQHEAIADILPTTFATATDAHNAMVRTAEAGRKGSLQTRSQFVPGADGIQYQTRFFGPDGNKDWAFVFAKGKIMVVIHTQQDNVQTNALLIGKAIVGKF